MTEAGARKAGGRGNGWSPGRAETMIETVTKRELETMKKIAFQLLLFSIFLLPFSLSAQTYSRGDKVEALWQGSWYKATIEQVMKENLYKVHFSGYWASREEIIPSERVRKIAERNQPDLNSLKPGMRVEFLEGDHWRPATFVEMNNKKALLRFADGESQKELWITLNRLSIVAPPPSN